MDVGYDYCFNSPIDAGLTLKDCGEEDFLLDCKLDYFLSNSEFFFPLESSKNSCMNLYMNKCKPPSHMRNDEFNNKNAIHIVHYMLHFTCGSGNHLDAKGISLPIYRFIVMLAQVINYFLISLILFVFCNGIPHLSFSLRLCLEIQCFYSTCGFFLVFISYGACVSASSEIFD